LLLEVVHCHPKAQVDRELINSQKPEVVNVVEQERLKDEGPSYEMGCRFCRKAW
jgi:hypothetical protein